MSRILLCMVSEPGHINGTFVLARALRERGHTIGYLAMAHIEPIVRAQGFDFVVFPELDFETYLRRIEDGDLDGRLRGFRPDLVICDVLLWYVALRSLKLGFPTMNLSSMLALHPNWNVPPILYGLRPGNRLLTRASWVWMRFTFLWKKWLAARLRGDFRAPRRMHHLSGVFRAMRRRAGVRVDFHAGEIGPRLRLPEVVLCPERFQLDGKPRDERLYAGDFVDVARPEAPLPAGLLDESRPLIYASLGSAAPAYPHHRRFYAAVFELARLLPDSQVVLHTGVVPPEALGAPPENLVVRPEVPQLALLRRARVMVTHGGMNSIMECVAFGVPMVIVPGLRDQPSNAVRATIRGLAVTTSMARVTGLRLADLIARAMADDGLRRGLAAMKQAIAEENGTAAAVALIERLAQRTGVAPAGT